MYLIIVDVHVFNYSIAIRSGLFVSAKQSCCYGCPVELRCKLWMMALGIDEPFTDIQVFKIKL